MNPEDDRVSQLLSDALDSLKLTEKNRRIAAQYLEQPGSADDEILKQTEYQDFAGLAEMERHTCRTLCKELRELAGQDLVFRYAKFMAAVGKASACYVLMKNRDMDWLFKVLTSEQKAAFWAETYAHASYTLDQGSLSVLVSMGRKDPEVLFRAMELCCGQDDASRMLLAAEYLYCTSQISLKNERTEEAAEYLEQRLLERLIEFLGGKTLSETERSELWKYIRKADVDESFPLELVVILRGAQCSDYRLALLAGCAYLAMEQQTSFGVYLKLAAAVAMESKKEDQFFRTMRYMADREWFSRHVRFLMEKIPIEPKAWVEWSLRTREESVWQYMIKECPEAVREAAKGLEFRDYEHLLERVRKVVPALYREIYDPEKYEQKAAQELVTNFETGAETARKYLLREVSLDQVLPLVKEWRKNGSGYYGTKQDRLKKLQGDSHLRQLYRRAVVLEGLLMHGTWFRFYMFRYSGGAGIGLGPSAAEIDEIFKLFQEEELPVSYQLDTLACIHESCYQYDSTDAQDHFQQECIEALDARIGQWGGEYKKAAVNGAAMTRIFCIQVMDRHWHEYKETLLSCAADTSKQVQQVLLEIYVNHREWEPEIKAMLGSRKQKERQMAVWVLKQWGVEQYRPELLQALEKEKNGKLSDYLQKLLCSEQDVDLQQLVKDLVKGGRRQKVQWAFSRPFEKIHTISGEEAPEDYLTAILVSYAYMETPGIHKDAIRLADQLQKAELSACMVDLFQRWLDTGAEAKKRWVLYAVSIHGGDAVIPLLHQLIRELPARFRGAMAVEAVRALALNGSSEALLLVDQISRKFKYRQVKQGAAAALADAAKELGISREELEDRIVPNLGFDGQMKKQLKTVAANQKLRFSQALVTGRFWQAERWQELFVKNPVMHQFATGLIWGVYEQGALKRTFRYMEDGTFNTVDEVEYAFPKEGTIGLIHPVELSEEELTAWKEQLADYEIEQPIDQLSRPVYTVTDEEAAGTELIRFKGKILNGLSLSGKLTGQGWNKGPMGDGGEYHTFYREDGDVGVTLSFSGCGITFENMDVAVYGAVFYQPGTDPKGKSGKQRYFLGEVSPRYFSEIVLQLTQATEAAKDGA